MKALTRFLALASKSNHSTHNHAAIVWRGGSIISQGHNRRYGRFATYGKGLHAEVAALTRVMDRRRLKGSTLQVVRVNQLGNFVMSRPCPDCIRFMREVGIAKMVYSNQDGEFEEERLTKNG